MRGATEGNGKGAKKDRKKFFEVARGAALECASCLDILVTKHRISAEHLIDGTDAWRLTHSLVSVGLPRHPWEKTGWEKIE